MGRLHIWRMLKEAGEHWRNDRAGSLSAALAYYAIFSVVPLTLIATAIAGAFFGEQAATDQIVQTLRNVVGERVASAIQTAIRNARWTEGGPASVIFGSAMLLFAATGAFSELQASLNRVWHVKPGHRGAVWSFVRKRLLTFLMVLVVGGLLVVSVAATAVLAVIRGYLAAFPWTAAMAELANNLILFASTVLGVAMIYKTLPDAKIAWRDVWLGAAITAVLFAMGTAFIGIYASRMRSVTTYGAAGFIIVLLFWVYVSAMIFFFGAEFTQVYARYRGRLIAAGRGPDQSGQASPDNPPPPPQEPAGE